MIIETTIQNIGGQQFNRLTSSSDYWGVGYDDNLNVITTASGVSLITTPIVVEGQIVAGWLNGGTVTDGLSNAFGASTFSELWGECKTRGLIFPEALINKLSLLGYD